MALIDQLVYRCLRPTHGAAHTIPPNYLIGDTTCSLASAIVLIDGCVNRVSLIL